MPSRPSKLFVQASWQYLESTLIPRTWVSQASNSASCESMSGISTLHVGVKESG